MQKNFPANRKKFGPMKEEFRHRQARALSKRLDTGGLTAKQVAHAIGCHADTVGNWKSGYCTMGGDDIAAIDEFFASIGDWGFIAEIYGDLGVRRRQRAEQLRRQAMELEVQAKMLEGAAA